MYVLKTILTPKRRECDVNIIAAAELEFILKTGP